MAIKLIQEKAPAPGVLGKSELFALSIGQVIGAGIITLVGPAIALTGYSAWFAYAIAIFYGFICIAPTVFVTSTLRLGGGYYSALASLASPRISGMYAFAFLTQCVSLSLFGIALGVYVQSIFPQVNGTVCAIVFMTLFYLVNLQGVSMMAKAQKLMTWLLLAALLMFAVSGLFHINNPVFNVSDPNFMTHGMSGLIQAMLLYEYSTIGYSLTMQYGRDAKNAKRDIPWALLMSVPTLLVLYVVVAIAGVGCLPLEQVSNQPLTYAAKYLLPTPLFILFMLVGPIMALMTTMNSSLANNCIPIAQSCKDGWLPKAFGKQNKKGAYVYILTFQYLLGLIPILFGFNITTITNNIQLLMSLLSFLYTYAYFMLPKKYPDAWKRSRYHIPNGLYYLICSFSMLGYLIVFIKSCMNLTPTVVAINIGAVLLCVALGYWRGKTGDITLTTSVWEDD